MPPQRTVNPLAKYEARIKTVLEKHKDDEIELGSRELPEGIEGGIAQIDEVRITLIEPGKDFAGEPQFYASATVLKPLTHNGVRTMGMRTFITEKLCDTPALTRKTLEDHILHVRMMLGRIGATKEQIATIPWEQLCAMLKESQPYIYFRTWKSKKQETGPYKDREPRVNHQWLGPCLDPSAEIGDMSDQGVDESLPGDEDGVASPPPGPARPATNGAPRKPAPKAAATAPPAAPPQESAEEFNEFQDPPGPAPGEGATLEELQRYAQVALTDVQAADAITNAALAVGLSMEEVNAAPDWATVVAQIDERRGGGAEEGPTELTDEEPAGPQVGEVWGYCPLDPATKVPSKTPVQVKVLAIDHEKGTCSVSYVADPKKGLKGVKLAALLPDVPPPTTPPPAPTKKAPPKKK